jgi:hypothetical protein
MQVLFHRLIYLHILIGICMSPLPSLAQDNANTPRAPGTLASMNSSRVGRHARWLAQEPPPITGVREHWDLFAQETLSPLTGVGTIFSAAFSQLTNSDPRYGSNAPAFGQRIGAAAADIVTQNFFGDFVVASALHEDPRYVRLGEEYSLWERFRYELSRGFVNRTEAGTGSENRDNFLGSAASAGFANSYYPPASRTRGAMLIHFGTDVADNAFINLAPEFWPDFRRKLLGKFHH